ncbi:DUF1761 domain-containing protein [Peribacillus alkalitolerans]|uniref:DUF1761 domain-containing protein n=1 Tax=Peribacillus alkalitolerans TaxID=1550385 RepID=UPI0013D75151|nr:DUF1761 domain-containing protein [Peribacillus alkalitolerans]
MNFTDVSFLAILLAAISNSIIGALWYSPLLFSNIWMKGMGKRKEDFDAKGANVGYMLTMIASLVTAYALSLFILSFDDVTIGGGALIGFLAGLGIASMRELAPTFFEGRKLVLYFISAGYHIVALTMMGIIIALFA